MAAFNGGTFNRFTFNGTAIGSVPVTDSESTSAITETEAIRVGSAPAGSGSAAESIWINPEGDTKPVAATFGAFTFGSMAFNGGTRTPGADWSIHATVPDNESTPAITETEQVIQTVWLDLSNPALPTFVDVHSLRWGHELNQRAWAQFRVIYPGGASSYYSPRPGHRFKLIDFDGVLRFHGTIHKVSDQLMNSQGTKRMFTTCQATGWEQVADRFIVSTTYTSQTLGAIAADLVTTYLAADGITATSLPTGPTLDNVVFSYRRVSDCFDELSRLTGYWWRITVDKNLEFYDPTAGSAAPLNLDATGSNYLTLQVDRDRSQYRNKQILGNVLTLTGTNSESFKGDDTNRTFPLAYPVHSAPTASIFDGVSTTVLSVGIRDVDTLKDLYWSKGSSEVATDLGLPPLATGETLTVTYVGEYTQIRAVTDSAEVADRQAIEGGTGIYEQYTDDGSGLTTAAAADAYAQSLIDRNAPIPSVVTFESDNAGNILPGQTLTITEPALGLSGDFFVSNTEFEVLPGTTDIRARVTCSSSQPEAAWQAALQKKRQTEDLTQLPTSGL